MQQVPQEQIIYWPEGDPSHRVVVRPNRIEVEQADGCAADGSVRWLPLAAVFEGIAGIVHFDALPLSVLVGLLDGVARQLVRARVHGSACAVAAEPVDDGEATAPRPGSSWSEAEDRELLRLVRLRKSPDERAQQLGRSVNSCSSRIRRLREMGRA